MKISPFLHLLVTLTFFSVPSDMDAQSDYDSIKAVVQQLFNGMRANDSTMVEDLFWDDATLRTIFQTKEGTTEVRTSPYSRFVSAVGEPHEDVWNEVIYDYTIHIDGPMAIVWTPYGFYIGEKFSHCGVNVFEMIKKDGDWRISRITDTRRRASCVMKD